MMSTRDDTAEIQMSSEHMLRIQARFERLYGRRTALRCRKRLAMLLGRYGVGVARRYAAGHWNESDAVLITYGDMVYGEGERPLQTLGRFLAERLRGAISTVHILPFFPSSSDDGFSVVDYRRVDPCFGRWEDLRTMRNDFSLMYDLVLNHCSRESTWFQDYILGVAPGRDYFIEENPETDLSGVMRPRSSPLLTPMLAAERATGGNPRNVPLLTRTVTKRGERHVWTTFSDDQIDLNFKNPDVLFEFLDILLFYVSMGARIIRLDAIAYLWKEIGTSCIHLTQVHEVVKLLRDMLDLVAPDVLLLTETNVPNEENLSYFGTWDEADMVYQFTLPPLLLHALLTGNAKYLIGWARSLKDLPPGKAYFNFTASHDGVGVRPLEGIIPEAEFSALLDAVRKRRGMVSTKRNSDGTDSPYELNVTYFSALAEPGDRKQKTQVDRFLCSQTVPLSLKGIPAIYFHSLFATPNDVDGVKATGRARTINRKKFELGELQASLRDETSIPARVFQEYLQRLELRSQHPAFHPDGAQIVLDLSEEVFAIERTSPDGREIVVALHNVSAQQITLDLGHVPSLASATPWQDIISGEYGRGGREITLEPYQACWIVPQS